MTLTPPNLVVIWVWGQLLGLVSVDQVKAPPVSTTAEYVTRQLLHRKELRHILAKNHHGSMSLAYVGRRPSWFEAFCI